MPVRIDCLNAEVVTNPCPICPGTDVIFTGLRFTYDGGNVVYIAAPYRAIFQNRSVTVSEVATNRKLTVKLQDTVYTKMSELRDRIGCAGGGGGGGGVSAVTVTISGNTLTVDVDGVNDSVPWPITITTSDPTVNDDVGDGYAVGRRWINTTTDHSWTLMDNTAGAAVWKRTDNIRNNLSAGAAPVAGDDSADGYEAGSVWSDGTDVWLCVDASVGAAVWIQLTTSSILDNFSAIVDPAVGDDTADGYSAGSRWYNTATDNLFLCVDATLGAATWLRIDNINHNFAAVADPTAGDDDADGYEPGSIWYNTGSGDLFLCVDASTGAAIWSPLSGGGGKVVYEPVADHCIVSATGLGITAANVSGTTTITVPTGVDLYSIDLKGTTVETDGSDALTVDINYGGTRNHDNDIDDMRVPHILVWDIAARLIGGPTTGLPFIQDGDNTPQRQIVGVGGGSPSITVRVISLSSTYSDWIVKLIF